MPTAPDVLYDRLQDPAEVAALFGTAEDTILDCKQWLGDEKGKRSMLAKAVSGFANGDGGVIVLGLVADSHGKDDPDLIKGAAYVQAPHEVKAKVMSFLQSDVEPLIQGLRVDVVPMETNGAGVVLVLVPSQDGLPVRSKQDWKFYLRSGSSTQNMPMTVLADRFGRRPNSLLEVSLSEVRYGETPGFSEGGWRSFDLCVTNMGRGVARFPALFVKPSTHLQRHTYGMPLWSEEGDGTWMSYRGTPKDVIYPGESRKVVTLYQRDRRQEGGVFDFDRLVLTCKTVCLDSPELIEDLILEADSSTLGR